MKKDPIVDEIREIRGGMLEECQGDLDKLLDRYQSSEVQDRNRVVTLDEVLAQHPLKARGDRGRP